MHTNSNILIKVKLVAGLLEVTGVVGVVRVAEGAVQAGVARQEGVHNVSLFHSPPMCNICIPCETTFG